MPPKTIKSKNNGCGTAPGNLVPIFYPFRFSSSKEAKKKCPLKFLNINDNVQTKKVFDTIT